MNLSLLVYLGFVFLIIFIDIFCLVFVKIFSRKTDRHGFRGWLIKLSKRPKFRLYVTASVSCFALWALFSLKSQNVGSDTSTYVGLFNDTAKDTLFLDEMLADPHVHYEVGFLLFTSMISHLSVPYIVYQALVYFIICLCLFYAVIKLSKNPSLSIFVFFTFTFYNFFISGLRQSLAISLCLAALTIALTRKKGFLTYFLFFLIIAIASSMHYSAALFSPVIFFVNLKISQKSMLALTFGFVMFYLFGYQLYNLVLIFISSTGLVYLEGYVSYSGGIGKTPILMIIFTIFSYLCLYPNILTDWYIPFGLDSIGKYTNPVKTIKATPVSSTKTNVLIYLMFFGCCLELLNRFSSGLGRGSIYFTAVIILLLPNALESFESRKTKYALKAVFVVGFIAFLFYYSIRPDTMNFTYELYF